MAAQGLRHFLNLADAGPEALRAILADAGTRKQARASWPKGASMPMRRWPTACWR
jgi:ornithine carbamoyltransferase